MELFREQGYEATTVDQIAQRAGLTPRTFFRYFTDKREALFAGTEEFEGIVIDGLRASTEAAPLARVIAVYESVASTYFDPRAEAVLQRRALIDSSPELQEREILKLNRVVAQVATCLEAQGLAAPGARLVSELGMLVFRNAFAQWAGGGSGALATAIRRNRDLLHELSSTLPHGVGNPINRID